MISPGLRKWQNNDSPSVQIDSFYKACRRLIGYKIFPKSSKFQILLCRLIVAPNGVAYASPEARPGVLPRLLREILETRIMVKGAMKKAPKSDKVVQRVLNARQFGLKLIANVTYGYTAAGFSGASTSLSLSCPPPRAAAPLDSVSNGFRVLNSHLEFTLA